MTHTKPKLLQHCQTRPPVPKPPGRPQGTVAEHTVRDNESFETVARKYGVPVKRLLIHNFGTTVPEYINWYLDEYVGCDLATPDHKNWRFSSTARPGKIYIPGNDVQSSGRTRTMANANPPYFVRFSADPASSAGIDHSQPAPGGDAHGAGHTSINFRGRGGLIWQPETGRPRADGAVPFHFRSVNIHFQLTDFVVQISSDYPEHSCAYNATLRHEVDEHILSPIGVMYGFRDQVVNALNGIPLPTSSAPRWIRPDQADAVEAEYNRQVGRVVQDFRTRVSAALRQAQAASDSPENYQRVYRQCPVEEWNRH